MLFLGHSYKQYERVRKEYGVNNLLISPLRDFRTIVLFFTDFLGMVLYKEKIKRNNKIYTALKFNAVYQFLQQLLKYRYQES